MIEFSTLVSCGCRWFGAIKSRYLCARFPIELSLRAILFKASSAAWRTELITSCRLDLFRASTMFTLGVNLLSAFAASSRR